MTLLKHHPTVQHIFNGIYNGIEELTTLQDRLPKRQEVERPHVRKESRVVTPDGRIVHVKPGTWK